MSSTYISPPGAGTPDTTGQSAGTTLIVDSSGTAVWKNPESYVLREWDFLVSQDDWQEGVTGSGSEVTQVTTDSSHPGIIKIEAENTGAAAMRAQERDFAIFFGGGYILYETIVNVPTLSDGTNTFDTSFGFGDGFNNTAFTDGIYFRYTNAENSGQWRGVTESGGTQTFVDSSVAVTAGQWYHFSIVINADATSVEFFIDGTSIGTSSTNIPTSAGLIFAITETVGTAARSIQTDYCKFYQELTAPRIG